MKKKEVTKNKKTIRLFEALFFGVCILILVFLIFRTWWW